MCYLINTLHQYLNHSVISKLGFYFTCAVLLNSFHAACAEAPAIADIPVFTAPEPVPGSAIIPTDIVPLPAQGERASLGENFQLKILQKLPSRFYFNFTQEQSFRTETNPFQYPTKRQYLRQLPPPPVFMNLPGIIQYSDLQSLSLCSDPNFIMRTLPTVTAGWSLTPNTQLFATYFLIRDAAFYNRKIDTTVQSIAGGLQHNFTVTRNSSLQASCQFREFYETLQQPQFDLLPSLTYSYVLTPRTVVYVNSLLQLRGKKYFQPATREIDPFYTGGFIYQKNGWAFSNSVTFVQNFRNIFANGAFIPINDYSFICDFEIARRLYRSVPGLQAYVRAEPIWNFASHNYPGFAGMDFRMYYGLRLSAGKPPLTAALQQIREQLKEESEPPVKPNKNSAPSSTSYLYPYQITAALPQPVHGYIADQILREALNSNAPINISAVNRSLASRGFVPVRRGRHIAYSHQAIKPSVHTQKGGSKIQPHSNQRSTPAGPPPAIATSTTRPGATTAVASATLTARAASKTKAGNKGGSKGSTKSAPLAQPISIAANMNKPASTNDARKAQKKKQAPEPNRRIASAKLRKGEFEMLLIPPLPPINIESQDPFADSGIDLKPPILLNTAH